MWSSAFYFNNDTVEVTTVFGGLSGKIDTTLSSSTANSRVSGDIQNVLSASVSNSLTANLTIQELTANVYCDNNG